MESLLHIPNAETLEAIQEVEAGLFNTYQNAEQLYQQLGIPTKEVP